MNIRVVDYTRVTHEGVPPNNNALEQILGQLGPFNPVPNNHPEHLHRPRGFGSLCEI